MIISKKELLNLYQHCHDEQSKASVINKEVNEDLKNFAKDNEINVKAVKAGYKMFQTYKKGTINPNDDDFAEIAVIVDDAFEE